MNEVSKQQNEHNPWEKGRQELALEMAGVGYWEYNLNTEEIQGSQQLRQIFGVDEQKELTSSFIRSAIHQDDLGSYDSEVRAAVKENRPFTIEGRIIRTDGAVRLVCVQAIRRSGKEESGGERIFGVIQDITVRRLMQSKTLFQETFNRLDIVIWSRDYETKQLRYISDAAEKVFGISQKEAFLTNSFAHLVYPADEKAVRETLYGGEHNLVEYRIHHAQTGETRWIQTHVSPEMVNDKISAIYGVSVDVTERKRPEEIMKAQNEVLSLIATGTLLSEILWIIAEQTNANMQGRTCSILLVDQEQNIFTEGASPGFPDIYHKAMLNKSISSMNNPNSWAVTQKRKVIVADSMCEVLCEHPALKQAAEKFGLKSSYVYPILSTDAEVVAVFALYSQIPGEPKGYEAKMIETFVYLTSLAIERKKNEKKILKLAYHDSLTGLYNRSHFSEYITVYLMEAKKSGGKLALLYIDLDQFKWVNDSLGHDIGDQLLAQAAQRMQSIVKEAQIFSRVGGDEFTLLLKDVTSEAEVLKVAEKLVACFHEPFTVLEHELRISMSVGISLYPDHGLTANVLMKRADKAMYKAKAEGRNMAKVYRPENSGISCNRLVLHTQLYKALAENQFLLHYQPRIAMKSGSVQSVEALIRWNHPNDEIISPSTFIPLAEASGFIVALGEWVMREACRQNKAWQDCGLPALRIAVNVSAQQFQQESFVMKVAEILEETRLDPELLEIEITESALMNQEEKNIVKLQELNQMGVYVSIDDFGTGYSSLNYLKSFEVQALKIDQTFIRDLHDDNKDAVIIKMIISLAHSLGLEVVGEGIETREQHDFLLQIGCEYAQGYLYSKPLPVADFEQKLQGYSGKINLNVPS